MLRHALLVSSLLLLPLGVRAQQTLPSPAQLAETRREIMRLTACFQRELGLDDVDIRVSMLVAPDSTWAAKSRVVPAPEGGKPIAEIDYELAWIAGEAGRAHAAVRHEMLHVVTAALFNNLYAYNRQLALEVAEWTVLRMAAWRLWQNVCR